MTRLSQPEKMPEYNEHYILQNPVNIYGTFFHPGTEYRQVNGDWWYPVSHDGALLPSYAVHFMVIRNNPNYFKPKPTHHD